MIGPFEATGSPDSGEVGEGSLAPDRPVMPYINSSQFDFVASVA